MSIAGVVRVACAVHVAAVTSRKFHVQLSMQAASAAPQCAQRTQEAWLLLRPGPSPELPYLHQAGPAPSSAPKPSASKPSSALSSRPAPLAGRHRSGATMQPRAATPTQPGAPGAAATQLIATRWLELAVQRHSAASPRLSGLGQAATLLVAVRSSESTAQRRVEAPTAPCESRPIATPSDKPRGVASTSVPRAAAALLQPSSAGPPTTPLVGRDGSDDLTAKWHEATFSRSSVISRPLAAPIAKVSELQAHAALPPQSAATIPSSAPRPLTTPLVECHLSSAAAHTDAAALRRQVRTCLCHPWLDSNCLLPDPTCVCGR